MYRRYLFHLFILLLPFLFISCAMADSSLRLARYFTSGMVLQRHQPIRIQGYADAGEKVHVVFLQSQQTVTCDKDGRWQVCLPEQKAGGPYILKVESEGEEVEVRDIYIGEVWLCSGQSNMQLPVRETKGAAEDIASASEQKRVHLYQMRPSRIPFAEAWEKNYVESLKRNEYYRPAQWTKCDAKTVADFSAIGYHFGRLLSEKLDCHVGIICNAVDGSLCESWIDRQTLASGCPDLNREWWTEPLIQQWARNRAKTNLKNYPDALPHHPYAPSYLFDCGIAPLSGMTIAGILWYQGEGNAHNATLHEQLFPLLQKSWRTHFDAPELPFYFVQLSGISTLPTWGHFRDSQRRLGVLPHTYMTVSHDLGEAKNIHPKRKREIAERLVAAALVHEYGQTGVPCGPVYLGAELKSNKILLHFQYGKGMHTSDGKAPKGFEVAGKNGAFVPAKARIVGEIIEVWSDAVTQPQQVRYAWESFPQANVVGSNGFPISTFVDRIF